MQHLEQPSLLSIHSADWLEVVFFKKKMHWKCCSGLHQNESAQISLSASGPPQPSHPLINGNLCLSLSLLNPTESFKVTS